MAAAAEVAEAEAEAAAAAAAAKAAAEAEAAAARRTIECLKCTNSTEDIAHPSSCGHEFFLTYLRIWSSKAYRRAGAQCPICRTAYQSFIYANAEEEITLPERGTHCFICARQWRERQILVRCLRCQKFAHEDCVLFPPNEQEYFCPSFAQEEWTQDDDGEDIVEVDNDVIIID